MLMFASFLCYIFTSQPETSNQPEQQHHPAAGLSATLNITTNLEYHYLTIHVQNS